MDTRIWMGNGIEADSGSYLRPSLEPARLAERLLAEGSRAVPRPRMPMPDIDPNDLSATGWAVVFPEGSDPALREALAPLLEHRRQEANAGTKPRYRELTYYPGETKNRFLVRHGVGPGPVMPDRLPYYLLFVGGPQEVPFKVQDELDIQYAVGRLDLETPDEHACYARSVVAVETAPAPRTSPPKAVIFAPANPDDQPTRLSCDYLARPLASYLASQVAVAEHRGGLASKENLSKLFGDEAPDLLFFAGHGMGFASGHRRQIEAQGALLCQDWPGPSVPGPVDGSWFFAGGDLDPAADLSGLIACFFACYSAGAPRWCRFTEAGEDRRELASRSFTAALPSRLLAHPGGSAQAVIGRVDRAWGYSYLWRDTGQSQIQAIAGTLAGILDGRRVGWALECFAQRHGELAVALFMALEQARGHDETLSPEDLARLWTATRDAQGWLLLGDPAVRIKTRARQHRGVKS